MNKIIAGKDIIWILFNKSLRVVENLIGKLGEKNRNIFIKLINFWVDFYVFWYLDE